jgi:hypothetical protein
MKGKMVWNAVSVSELQLICWGVLFVMVLQFLCKVHVTAPT